MLANVAQIREKGFRLITAKIPQTIRRELAQGVKDGLLGHLKRDGLRPEAYFHPNSKWRALEARDRVERQAREAIARVLQPSRQFGSANHIITLED
jgi:hypothetical protein